MVTQPFTWIGNQAVSTPEAARRQRAIAESLIGRSSTPASNWGQGLNHIASALTGTVLQGRADEAEATGRDEIAAMLVGLSPDSGFSDIAAALSNPWIADNPGASSIASALLGQNLQRNDPMYQMNLERAGLELDALRNPAVDPFAGTQVINNQLVGMGDGGPQVLGDFRTNDMFNQLSPEEAAARGLDPNKAWQVGPDNRVYEAGNSPLVTVNTGDQQTPGWKKIDETFGETYLDWVSGGWADTQKQLQQLEEASNILANSGDVTGAVGLLPREVAAFVNPDGTIARENVEEVVQRSLREILGAQFTEREGERLIARAFNPLLSPQENAKRVSRLLDTIRGMAESKQGMVNYFDENGTLRGFQGQRVNARALDDLAKDFGASPEETTAPAVNQSPGNPEIMNNIAPQSSGGVIDWTNL